MHSLTCMSVVVCVVRKPRPCNSYSRRRDRINSVLWRSYYKGGGGYKAGGGLRMFEGCDPKRYVRHDRVAGRWTIQQIGLCEHGANSSYFEGTPPPPRYQGTACARTAPWFRGRILAPLFLPWNWVFHSSGGCRTAIQVCRTTFHVCCMVCIIWKQNVSPLLGAASATDKNPQLCVSV